MTTAKNKRICPNGHTYYKSSDCPTCPVCEQQRAPQTGFMAGLGAPARRALENAGIHTLGELSRWTESDLLKLHGMGPASLPKLRKTLEEEGLSFSGK